ncbi:MAG: PKD domain-containing protein [Dehalococcoidia bacterium]
MKRIVFSLVIVLILVVTACSHGSQGTVHSLSTPPPSGWPTIWTGLSTDPGDGGGEDHRDVTDTNGDGYALYYAADSQYLYLRMETVEPPGWPSTKPTGDARYKWWFDTAGMDLYISGTSVYKAEFLLILEDRTDASNVDGSRDQSGEVTLMDDLANIGFAKRWNSGGSGAYIGGTPDSGGNSSLWKRVLGSGTAGTGGPQGVMAVDIGYRIDNATTGGNFTDMYVSWAVLGNPSSLCLIWATDNQVVNLDQAPNLDRPEATSCLAVCTPPQAAFNATPTSGCAALTVNFTDQSTGNITGWNWTFGDGGTSTDQNPSHEYTSAGSYNVTLNVTTACGSDTEIKTDYITVYAKPTATASSNSPVCEGATIELYGGPGGMTSYSWTGPNGFSSSLQSPTIPNATLAMAGLYTLTVTDGGCTSDPATTNVVVNESPTADAGADWQIIQGGSVVIGGSPTASGGTPLYTYSWTPITGLNDASFANPTASPAVNTTYTVTVTDSNGCTDSDDVTVTVTQGCCICGFVYRAGTTEALAGWEVVLEKHTNPWVEVRSTITDANGKYCFCGLEDGEYRVSEVVQANWNQVSPLPNEHLVTLPGGASDPVLGPFLNFENEQRPAGSHTVGWEASPIDKLAVLAPWIALFALIIAGASLLVLRRHRV